MYCINSAFLTISFDEIKEYTVRINKIIKITKRDTI